MHVSNRIEYILHTALSSGFVSIADAASHLHVSIETIRRDINHLCSEGKLRKVRGGACPVKLNLRRDDEYLLRKGKNQQSKIAIGQRAAQMIRDNMIVMFDCGVSIEEIASSVSHVRNLTCITNSIPVASILLNKFSAGDISGRIIMIGGELNTENRFSAGSAATEMLDRFCADLAFISCTAVSERGISTDNMEECSFSAHILSCCSTSVLVTESDKLGKNSLYRFAELTAFNHIITDDQHRLPESILDRLAQSDTELVIVNLKEEHSR